MGTNKKIGTNKGGLAESSRTVDAFIERLKKIRALNGDPSFFGIDGYVIKKIHSAHLAMFMRS